MAKNQKAFHEYFVDEKFEAGIELVGTEVKSIRAGTLSLKEAWCQIKDGEMWIRQMHIAPYEKGNIFNRDPDRVRRLLCHKAFPNAEYESTSMTTIQPSAALQLSSLADIRPKARASTLRI